MKGEKAKKKSIGQFCLLLNSIVHIKIILIEDFVNFVHCI